MSALDQVVASGDSGDVRPSLADVIEGMVAEDAAACLVAVVKLYEAGWTPAQLAVDLADDLRQAFLLSIEPTLAEVVGADRERLSEQVGRLGRPRCVRALELIGRAQVDMRDAPDPQIILEVAILRAARSDLDVDVAALTERINRLERRITELALAPAPSAPASVAEVRQRRATAGEGPGSYAPSRAKSQRPTPASAPEKASTKHDAPEVQEGEPAAQVPDPKPTIGSHEVTKEEFAKAWETIIGQLKSGLDRAMYKSGVIIGVTEGTVHIGVSTETHKNKCLESREAVEAAIASVLGAALRVEIEVTSSKPSTAPARTAAPVVEEPEEVVDLDDLVEAPPKVIETLAESRLLEAFPGAVEEDA